MNVNTDNIISIEEDIKQIAVVLQSESKIKEIITIRYFEDTDSEPCIKYKRLESVPLMEEMELLEINRPIKEDNYPRNRFFGDTDIIVNKIYEVKVNSSQLNKFIQNSNIDLFLKRKFVPFVYNP